MLVLAAHLPLTTIVMHLSLVIQERSSGKVRGKEKAEELYRIGMASLRAAAEREKGREEFLDVF